MVNPQALSSVRKFPVRHEDGRTAQAVKWVANDKAEAEILVLHPDGRTTVERMADWAPDVPIDTSSDARQIQTMGKAESDLREVLNENFYKI